MRSSSLSANAEKKEADATPLSSDTSAGGVNTEVRSRRRSRKGSPKHTIVRISTYLLVLVGWHVLSIYVVGTATLPPPWRVWEKLMEIFELGLFSVNFLATLQTFLVTFALGFVIGTVIGVLMGRTRYFEAFFRDAITVIMGLPGVVIIIVCLMIWALSPWGRILAVTLGLIPLVAINVAEGARAVPKDLLDMATSYGISQRRRLREIVMPAVAPYVFAGARYGLAVGFKGTAMMEVFGGSSGMGFQLRTQFTQFSIAGVMAWTALILLIVIVLEMGILKNIERRVFQWRQSAFV